MAQVAIKGHRTRGKEVIQLLEMLGGKNIHRIDAIRDYYVYFVMDDKNKTISSLKLNQVLPEQFIIYSLEEFLEEFLEKFPYKVGDKVIIKAKNQEAIIDKIVWCCNTITYWLKYDGIIEGNWRVGHLQPYKEETIKESIDKTNKVIFENNAQSCDISNEIIKKDVEEIKIDIPNGYEFFGIDDDNKIVLTKIQSQYPKTYEECCRIIDYHLTGATIIGYEKPLLGDLQQLLICRDAYWKIAGEEMGLDKPWKPDWSTEYENKYVIEVYRNNVRTNSQGYSNTILAFPTKEMRDAFYENFKELINDCKELL